MSSQILKRKLNLRLVNLKYFDIRHILIWRHGGAPPPPFDWQVVSRKCTWGLIWPDRRLSSKPQTSERSDWSSSVFQKNKKQTGTRKFELRLHRAANSFKTRDSRRLTYKYMWSCATCKWLWWWDSRLHVSDHLEQQNHDYLWYNIWFLQESKKKTNL